MMFLLQLDDAVTGRTQSLAAQGEGVRGAGNKKARNLAVRA
jgi:hypothetical protein